MVVEYLKKSQTRLETDSSLVIARVARILKRVSVEGEEAVRFYSQKFDNWNPSSFRLSPEEIAEAEKNVPRNLKKEILFLRDQVRNFSEAQKRTLTNFELETHPGVFLGQRY